VGWTKGLDRAKVEGGALGRTEISIVRPVAQSRALPKEDFRREVEKELTGKEEERSN
jgi:hypothetical protein